MAKSSEFQTVKPTANVYTVLVAAATVAVGLTIFVLYKRTEALFGGGLF